MPLTNVPNAAYVVRYNSFQFDPNTTETLSVRSRSVYDSAGRTIVYIVWTFVIRSIIYAAKDPLDAANGTTDFQLNAIRQLLSSPAGAFEYTDRGFGELSINTGHRQKDVVWGPKPQELSWEPWGDGNAALVTWQVDVAIPECNSAKFEGHALEWNFTLSFDRDEDGFTSRKVQGHLVIPQTRTAQGNRQFRHSADEYRGAIAPRVPVGFRPLRATFKLSEDKNRLDFSFDDEEMGEDIPPPGIIRIDADLQMENDKPANFFHFIYTLTATYTVAKFVPLDLARMHFRRLAFLRRKFAKRAGQLVPPNPNGGGLFGYLKDALDQAQFAGDPTRFSIVDLYWRVGEPQIYKKAKQARFSYTFALTRQLPGILQADGFWFPVPDSNWQNWATGLRGSLFRPRAGVDANGVPVNIASIGEQAGLYFDPSDDLIIDLCQRDIPEGGGIGGRLKPAPRPAVAKLKGADKPDADTGGWITWEQSFHFECHAANYVHKPLDEPQSFNSTLRSGGAPGAQTSTLRTPNLIPAQGGVMFSSPTDGSINPDATAIVGQRSAPTYYVIYEGRAARVGQPINCPVIKSVAGVPVVPANRPGDGFRTMRVPGLNVIHFARWRLRFLVPTRIGTTADLAPNPMLPDGVEPDEWTANEGGGMVAPGPDPETWEINLETSPAGTPGGGTGGLPF